MPAVWHTSSTDPVIWKSESSTQTLDGISDCLVRFDYRIARNGTIDIRFFVTCPSAPTSFNFNVIIPADMPSITPAPLTGIGVYGPVVGSGGPSLQFYTARLTDRDMVIFSESNFSTDFEGSFFATVIT